MSLTTILFAFSNTAHACTSAVRATLFNSCCANSFLLSYGPNRPELNSIEYKIYGVCSSVNMSCNSTKLKKSNSDWLNSGKAVIQRLLSLIHISEPTRPY